jgi:methyl-accepting chemotaxis protein
MAAGTEYALLLSVTLSCNTASALADFLGTGKHMKLDNLDVARKVWLVVTGLMLAMLAVAGWAQSQAGPTANWAGFGGMVAVFVVGLLLTAALARSITQPLARAVAVADAITAGDLTVEAHDDRHDEFGQLLRSLSQMAARLRSVVSEVRTGVESVSLASSEIANGNHDLSGRTEQTASNLQQTASSMEQLTSTVTQSVETARQANQLASMAAQTAMKGGDVVGQVVSSMEQISASSRKINDIIGVIDGIAFQTNILALNAAVEAARAGEQGRGFAVVAAEVRSLAQRSAQAAKEIKTLISSSVDTVQSGSQQVAQAGQTMGEIVSSVRRVTDLIGEITASAQEQRDGIGQVNQAVGNLDQMTQQNAALVEESAAAASALHDQAQRLGQVVAGFNVGVMAVAPPSFERRPVPPVARTAPKAVATKPAASRVGLSAVPAPALARPPAPAPVAAPAGSDSDWESF